MIQNNRLKQVWEFILIIYLVDIVCKRSFWCYIKNENFDNYIQKFINEKKFLFFIKSVRFLKLIFIIF
jgi:hypothetical protein